ncbi:MAG: nucleoid occlusion factor SlmA [Proteobacteria bacterium]|jgi:TetR/AcrR family transcriptional regulator|nr:nucleoid occlusion factor SlmA [Pseudomonadota bacterium]
MTRQKGQRRQEILETLADMLEKSPGGRVTTSALAEQVGVSEAALYRHFPSKTKMFEGLIEFIEDTLFTRISLIIKEQQTALLQCERILTLLLGFAEKNPGITRLMTGDILNGETERLRIRVSQLFDRLETQLKQILREAELKEQQRVQIPVAAAANLMMAAAEGRLMQFVRSEFKRSPTAGWSQQWQLLTQGFLR